MRHIQYFCSDTTTLNYSLVTLTVSISRLTLMAYVLAIWSIPEVVEVLVDLLTTTLTGLFAVVAEVNASVIPSRKPNITSLTSPVTGLALPEVKLLRLAKGKVMPEPVDVTPLNQPDGAGLKAMICLLRNIYKQ